MFNTRQISPPEETTVELNGRLETIVGTFEPKQQEGSTKKESRRQHEATLLGR